jgi:hypothetical protein
MEDLGGFASEAQKAALTRSEEQAGGELEIKCRAGAFEGPCPAFA